MIVDAFGGPGGWDEAAASLGLTTIGIEHDAAACATRAAAGHLTIRADVAAMPVERFRPLTGLIASPPCPTFSQAGGRAGIGELGALIAHVHACMTGWRPYVPPANLGYDEETGESIPPDPRSALVLEPLRYALGCVPEWVALEQVPDVLPVWQAVAHVLRGHGWSVWTGVLNSADYGVPQTRRRAILLAHRRRSAQPPEATHCESGASTMFGELAPWVSMADALGWDAPPIVNTRGNRQTPGGNEFDSARPSWALTEKARSWVLAEKQAHGAVRTMDEPAMTIPASATNGNYAFVLNTGRDWKTGGTREDAQTIPGSEPAPTLAMQSSRQWQWRRPATTVQGDPRVWPPGHKLNADDERRLGVDEAAARYGDRAGSEAIRLSVRDALVLQSFRPDYPVQGSKTKKFEQIGNAIPPLLARALLASLTGET